MLKSVERLAINNSAGNMSKQRGQPRASLLQSSSPQQKLNPFITSLLSHNGLIFLIYWSQTPFLLAGLPFRGRPPTMQVQEPWKSVRERWVLVSYNTWFRRWVLGCGGWSEYQTGRLVAWPGWSVTHHGEEEGHNVHIQSMTLVISPTFGNEMLRTYALATPMPLLVLEHSENSMSDIAIFLVLFFLGYFDIAGCMDSPPPEVMSASYTLPGVVHTSYRPPGFVNISCLPEHVVHTGRLPRELTLMFFSSWQLRWRGECWEMIYDCLLRYEQLTGDVPCSLPLSAEKKKITVFHNSPW